MIDFVNETVFHAIDLNILETIVKRLSKKSVELLIVDSKKMQKLNKQYRGVDKTTDVLSFPFEDIPHAPLGSIVINADLVQQKSRELGHTPQDEVTLLFIHGLLHLLGYDHEIDNGEMRAMEEKLIKEYNLPQSLIIRTQKKG